VRGGEIIEKPKHYAIDAEIGRLGIHTFEIKEGSQKVFSTEGEVFPETCSREAYKTVCYREVVLFFPCDMSFRKSAEKINRMWWRQAKSEQIRSRTITNLVEREGKQIQEHLSQKAEGVLTSNGFSSGGKPTNPEQVCEPIEEQAFLPREHVCAMIEELNAELPPERHIDIKELHETFEDPKQVRANISLDDVCCKKQKEEGRNKGAPPKEKREMVYNTVAHIQNGDFQAYTLNTANITQMMIIVLAFLVATGLMKGTGPFVFTDGAQDLRKAIVSFFAFFPFKIILDWYHLEKKCKDLLSMAITGKKVKESILRELIAWLWLGKTERALSLLRSLSPEQIKNQKELDHLIGYLDRHRDAIPCYALRQKLGLRVSSNPVEKANDVVVSQRQKHNGMSWSPDGSTSLATLTAVRRNSQDFNWLRHRDISFQLSAVPDDLAA
jgi:hypothetical protein